MKNSLYINKIIIICMLASLLIGLCCYNGVVKAQEEFTEGTYEVKVTNDLPMGGDNFKDKASLEVIQDNYYLGITVLDNTQVERFRLNLSKSDSCGCMVIKNGKEAKYIFSLNREDLNKELSFSGFVPAMKKEITANIRLDLNSAKRVSEEVEDLGERPARIIPTLNVLMSDSEMEKGSFVIIPTPNASMEGQELAVEISAYKKVGDEKINIDIVDNKILLDQVGEYHIIFKASSNKYLTSLQNDTFNIKDVKIISKVGASAIVKLEKDSTKQVQASYKDQSQYLDKMKKIADNYEVINVVLFDKDGNVVENNEKRALYLRCNDAYNRNKVKVYYVGETLEEVKSENFGRYVKVETDKVGDFIVCEEGVEFVMPMWSYAVIVAVVSLIVIAVIVVIIVISRKKAKQNKEIYK